VAFFASLPNFTLHEHPKAFKIQPPSKWPWFFLRRQQLFLFLQDPTHLVTKWRNRLLSPTAELRIGKQSIIMEHLHRIVENDDYTKLDHGLTKSDLNPKDKQNYSSCLKLVSDDLLKILISDPCAQGTFLYLQLLQLIISAYIERSTPIVQRK